MLDFTDYELDISPAEPGFNCHVIERNGDFVCRAGHGIQEAESGSWLQGISEKLCGLCYLFPGWRSRRLEAFLKRFYVR